LAGENQINHSAFLSSFWSKKEKYCSCNMGYLNSVLSSTSQVRAIDDGPVSGGGLRYVSCILSLPKCFDLRMPLVPYHMPTCIQDIIMNEMH